MTPDAEAMQFLAVLLQQVQSGRVRVTDYRLTRTLQGHEARIRYVPASTRRPCACAAVPMPTRSGWLCPICGAEWQDGKEDDDADPDADF